MKICLCASEELPPCFRELRCWSKSDDELSADMSKRYHDLANLLGTNMQVAEGFSEGPLSFSRAVPHGAPDSHMGTVMMTRIKMDDRVFLHASDIQLLDDATVEQIIDWQIDIVLASGPPLYLDLLGEADQERGDRPAHPAGPPARRVRVRAGSGSRFSSRG